ncbi:MAG: toll/interleukin-1 receptor domain-containing protein [Acidobacteriota bacterium]
MYEFDDEHNNGRLTEFRKNLSAEVKAQTGNEVPIFQDRDAIEWGQNWKQRIERSINEVTFLIPVITPSFFRSSACRKELELFLEREKRLGRNDLILPLCYIDTPLLSNQTKQVTDPLAEIVASRQYADWRDLRFEPFSSPIVGRTLAQLAIQIRNALERTSSFPHTVTEQTKQEEESQSKRGVVEAGQAVKELLSEIEKIGPAVSRWMNKVDEQIDRFEKATTPAQQQRTATLMASHLRNGSKELEQMLPKLDETVDVAIEFISAYIARRSSLTPTDREELSTFRRQISGMLEGVKQLLGIMRSRSSTVLKLGDISADMDGASKRMAKGLQGIVSSFMRLESSCSRAILDIDGKLSDENSEGGD